MRLDATRVALVTGAASGIGAALARDLDRRGVQLALCDVDEAGLEQLVDTFRGTPLVARVDVSDEHAVRAFAEQARSKLGAPHLVIANAGIAHIGTVAESTTEEIRRVIDVNLWGGIHTTRAVLPSMLEAREGTIVLVSSVFGLIGVAGQSAYCAAKAGVKGFGESLDLEVRGRGLDVLVVHPGAVATNIARSARYANPGRSRAIAEKIIDRGVPAAVAAQDILDAVEAGRRRLVIGRDARILAALQRLLPVHYRTVLRRQLGRS